LRDAGVLSQLWFYADNSGFGDLPDADRQRLIKYAMARLSGYVNTMFILALEWQEGWSTTEVAVVCFRAMWLFTCMAGGTEASGVPQGPAVDPGAWAAAANIPCTAASRRKGAGLSLPV